MSHKYVTKVVLYILVQLSSLQVSGRWSLATGQKRACDELSRVEARSKQPEIELRRTLEQNLGI
jgi:hypothetical protein